MNNNYNIIRIQQYLKGELNAEETYRMEREALDDPFLQDVIDGYREAEHVDIAKLSMLQQRLADRVAGRQEKRDAFFFGVQRLAIAATAGLLFVLAMVLFWMRSQPNAPATENEVAVELVPLDTQLKLAVRPLEENLYKGRPRLGWEDFIAYIGTNQTNSVSGGKVILLFDISDQGKPINIREESGSDTKLLEEVKRLLSHGPLWQGDSAKLELTFVK